MATVAGYLDRVNALILSAIYTCTAATVLILGSRLVFRVWKTYWGQ